jgi:hypothetical protein
MIFTSSTIFAHAYPYGGGHRSYSLSLALVVPLPARGLPPHFASKMELPLPATRYASSR